jgi:hypothetical protein
VRELRRDWMADVRRHSKTGSESRFDVQENTGVKEIWEGAKA